MLIYLPERLYESLKNNEYYHNTAQEYSEELIYKTDYLNIINHFLINVDNRLVNFFNYIRDKMPKDLQLEYDVVMSDDLSKMADKFEDMDIETKIYYLYAYNNGDMAWDKEAEQRNQLCMKLYEENILDKNYDCSLFIHTIYYLRVVYELIYKYTNRKFTIKEFDNFIEEESKIYQKMASLSDNESYKHIMFSKREQMYIMYLEFVGQFIQNRDEFYKRFWEIIDNKDFKYNYFSYFKLSYYLICFQQSIDNGEINRAKRCLDKLIELITYAYDDKENACKSLNHYNKAFIDDFLVLSKFVYDMVSKYMPNLDKKWEILKHNNLQPAEYRYYKEILTNEDKQIVKTFNVVDRFFSYRWLLGKKEIFETIDSFYA